MLLLDTNVVSELRKVRSGKADAHVARWADNVDAAELFVSVITIQELEFGILQAERKDAPKGAILRAWMDQHVLPAFAERILPVDTAVALRSAALHVPEPRPVSDALIAATALVHGMSVVTRNASDFEPMGVQVINPWLE
ncbi:type II toxin-antitoxin system VapC family toxin [Stenotrophomonas tumulicola]|uniref:Ribonuclease VapC n=1 Tax=Stenotrophomonas tumulicola TaxID=1685415 RepID=A0A7W3FLH8_9GAMM|nr:type II toxin-antitoxin system VapC family toxin [Stenotrophomonas tumulicola]MBA8681432.1 type II toxin-antitoxin system VapC family toxin [Stenotrophomonas tumulicola]